MWPFKRKPKPTWTYVTTVHGSTVWIDGNGEKTGAVSHAYWVLLESDQGDRKVKKVGESGNSQLARRKEAEVEAWVNMGPLPPETEPFVPEPRKPRRTADLIVFEGGKTKSQET
jgi:hypothetical protein